MKTLAVLLIAAGCWALIYLGAYYPFGANVHWYVVAGLVAIVGLLLLRD